MARGPLWQDVWETGSAAVSYALTSPAQAFSQPCLVGCSLPGQFLTLFSNLCLQVDEVDDSRKTLAFLVSEMLKYFDEVREKSLECVNYGMVYDAANAIGREGRGCMVSMVMSTLACDAPMLLQAADAYTASKQPGDPEWVRPTLGVFVIHNK